jgi:hypothetical protein
MTLLTVADRQASICPSISVPGGDCDRPIVRPKAARNVNIR